jgi:hypothetical protein
MIIENDSLYFTIEQLQFHEIEKDNDFVSEKQNKCFNCNIKLHKKYLKIIKIEEDKNLLCQECFNLLKPNNENSMIMIMPRNKLDHISQNEFIYYFRFLYILELHYLEINEINKNFKSSYLFQKKILDNILYETTEFFEEELISETDEEEMENIGKLYQPLYLREFINNYFKNDDEKKEDVENDIILFPLFQNNNYDILLKTNLLNKINGNKIKEDLLTFINNNKELLNISNSLKLLN